MLLELFFNAYIWGGLYISAAIMFLLRKERACRLLLLSGIIFHFYFLIYRAFIPGIFLSWGMVEGVFFTPLVMALILLVVFIINKQEGDFLTGILPLAVFSIFAMFYPKGVIPPTPNKITVWAYLFFITENMGYALFYLGCWYASVNYFKKNKSDSHYPFIVWGFVLFSISQVVGAVWALLGWGSVFRWGSRHLQSAAIWCYFAACLHLRFLPLWDKRKKLLFTAAGIIIVVVSSFGSYLHEMGFPRIGGQ